RAVEAGEIDTFLERDLVVVGAEGPDILVRKHKLDMATVRRPRRLDLRVEVEAYGVLVGGCIRERFALAGIEQVLAGEPVAVGGKGQAASMHETKHVQVSVMGGTQRQPLVVVVTVEVDASRSLRDRTAEQAPERLRFEEAARGGVVE